MSHPTVNWVRKAVAISSSSSSLVSLTVAEQGVGCLVSGGGQVLQLFVPRLGRAIYSFIAWIPTVGWDPL